MPQIKLPLIAIFIAAGLTLGGCGDKNDKAIFTQETAHKANADWVHTHKTTVKTPATAQADLDACAECHGGEYEGRILVFDGGISKVNCMSGAKAQSGFTCHFSSPVEDPAGCVSCHGGLPNGPFGTTAPNRQGAHTKHTALSGIGCAMCHLNAGSGTSGHAKATTQADGTLGYSKATIASYDTITFNDNGTCDNVSCHGGKTTPVWTASINMGDAADPTKSPSDCNVVCKQCHEQGTSAGRPQYNSYYSGLHVFHIGGIVGAKCTDCHNIGTLTNFQQHFGGIATKTFTSPKNTIGNAPTKILTYTYSAAKGGYTCAAVTNGCHSAGKDYFPWIQP